MATTKKNVRKSTPVKSTKHTGPVEVIETPAPVAPVKSTPVKSTPVPVTPSSRSVSLASTLSRVAGEQLNALSTVLADKYGAYEAATQKALNDLNKSTQTDVFDSILTDENPLVKVCVVGEYAPYTVSVDKVKGVKIENGVAPFDFSSFIAAYNVKYTASPVSSNWSTLAITAVKFAAIHTAEEMEVDPATYVPRLKLTDDEKKVVVTDFNGIHASMSDVKTALQNSVNAIFGYTPENKPRYFIKSADARALCQMLNYSIITHSVVVPRDDTKIAFFFDCLRSIVGGMPYKVDVKVKEKKNEKK